MAVREAGSLVWFPAAVGAPSMNMPRVGGGMQQRCWEKKTHGGHRGGPAQVPAPQNAATGLSAGRILTRQSCPWGTLGHSWTFVVVTAGSS